MQHCNWVEKDGGHAAKVYSRWRFPTCHPGRPWVCVRCGSWGTDWTKEKVPTDEALFEKTVNALRARGLDVRFP
jgi:hypothetical protein